MIVCSRCKTENEDGVKFCRECGNDLITNVDAPAKDDLKNLADSLNEQAVHTEKQPFNLNKAISEVPKKLWCGIKKSIFFRKKKNTIITCSSLLVIILLIIGVLNSGYIAFTMAYNMGKYDTAKSIQGWSFNSNFVKTSIEKFVISKMDDYYNDFSAEKITYDEATENFKTASDFCTNKDAKSKTDKLQTSRTAFLKAEEYEKSGDTYNAVIEYQKVIEEDKNYNTAKEQIEKNKPAVKKEAISRMDKCAAVNDFNTGLKIVSDMEKIFTNDSDINNYKKDFEVRKEAHRIQELKDSQKVKVVNAYSYNDGYYYIFRKGTAVIQNCSNQVLKEYTVAFLMFDSNGYPVEVEYSYQGDGNCQLGRAPSANVQPGATYGRGYYWDLPDHATKVKACVKSAEFYDGTTWNNPYYDHWLETEKDRY